MMVISGIYSLLVSNQSGMYSRIFSTDLLSTKNPALLSANQSCCAIKTFLSCNHFDIPPKNDFLPTEKNMIFFVKSLEMIFLM